MIKRLLSSLFSATRALPKQVIDLLLKAADIKILTKQQTDDYLKPYQLAVSPAKQVFLPGVQNQAELTTLVFPPCKATTFQSYVWGFQTNTKKTGQLPYGSIVLNGKILCPDFESYHLVKNFLSVKKRAITDQKTVIVPWSHYLDGISFGGYYDFVVLVAAKLCRIKEALQARIYAEAVVSYPLFKTAYEQEYLSLIGIEPDHVFDSRQHDVRADWCILANSGHWFYPDPADIFALKKQIEARLNIERTQQNRIYISRAGRRKVVNETALFVLLKKYNFIIIDDRPRSVVEQVAIYKNAAFIMGPHGASFTNIIWCEPGTYLFELFPPTLIVDHFSYLSQIMEMSYSAYSHPIQMGHTKYPIEEDIFVSIADLELSLNKLLEHV